LLGVSFEEWKNEKDWAAERSKTAGQVLQEEQRTVVMAQTALLALRVDALAFDDPRRDYIQTLLDGAAHMAGESPSRTNQISVQTPLTCVAHPQMTEKTDSSHIDSALPSKKNTAVKMVKKLSAIKIASLNIRGKAASNSDELCKLLKSEKVDVIGLQEVLSAEVNVKDFVWCGRHRCPRSQVGSGRTNEGVGFLIRSSIKSRVFVISTDKEFEVTWLKVVADGATSDTYVCNVYAPGENYSIMNRQAFFNALSEQCL
jgi:hypothetical protein